MGLGQKKGGLDLPQEKNFGNMRLKGRRIAVRRTDKDKRSGPCLVGIDQIR